MNSLFQKKVYEVVKKIPKGGVLTYKKVSELAGKNLKIPCHRVIRSNGRIGGYNKGKKKKAYLLSKEGVVIKKDKVVR